MRVLVMGGTWFLGRRVVERLHERDDRVLVVHRARSTPDPWVPVAHLLSDRRGLGRHSDEIRAFDPKAVVDTIALTGTDVDAVLPVLPEVPTVVLSSQDVYEAHAGLRSGTCVATLPLTEDSELRHERYPYRGLGIDVVPDDYEKLDVEERWLERDAVVLRLPLVYGPHDWQRREEIIPRSTSADPRPCPSAGGSRRSCVRRDPTPSWCASPMTSCRRTSRSLPRPRSTCSSRFARAEALLGWAPADPAVRIAESIRWHLEHPPNQPTWSEEDTVADDAALAAGG